MLSEYGFLKGERDVRRVGFYGTNDLDLWLFELGVGQKVKAPSKWVIS